MRKIDRNHIVLTLGIGMPLNESYRELSEGLKGRILSEQMLFESFIDSLAKYAGEKWNKAVATVRDWKDAAVMLAKIISDPKTLANFSIGLWKSFKNTDLKKFKAVLANMGLQNVIPQIDRFVNSITALQGWKKFMAATAVASITKYIITKLSALKPEAMMNWVSSYFSDEAIGRITSKLTDFTTYVGWLQPIIKGTEIMFAVLKPLLATFAPNVVGPAQQAPEAVPVTESDRMSELRECIRGLVGEMMQETGHMNPVNEYADDLDVKDYPKSKSGWKLDQLSILHRELPNMPNYVIMDLFAKSNERPYDKEEFEHIIKKWKDYKWELKRNFPISMDIFDKRTIEYIAQREGGTKNPFKVPNDAKRHEFQKKMVSKGMPTEPIIIVESDESKGKYELLEGWHRTIQLLNMYPEGYVYPQVYIGYK